MDINPDTYLARFQKPETVYDICADIGKYIDRSTGTVMGMTTTWSMHQLVKSREIAQKDPIGFWVYRKSLKHHE